MIWVATQALLFGLIILLPLDAQFKIPEWSTLTLGVLSGIGFAILLRAIYDLRQSLSVSPTPVRNGQLQTKGIYSWIRHPMYVAVWLILGSGAINSGSYTKLALFVVLVGFFVLKTRHEEKLLISKYKSYEEYMSRVGAYWPRWHQ